MGDAYGEYRCRNASQYAVKCEPSVALQITVQIVSQGKKCNSHCHHMISSSIGLPTRAPPLGVLKLTTRIILLCFDSVYIIVSNLLCHWYCPPWHGKSGIWNVVIGLDLVQGTRLDTVHALRNTHAADTIVAGHLLLLKFWSTTASESWAESTKLFFKSDSSRSFLVTFLDTVIFAFRRTRQFSDLLFVCVCPTVASDYVHCFGCLYIANVVQQPRPASVACKCGNNRSHSPNPIIKLLRFVASASCGQSDQSIWLMESFQCCHLVESKSGISTVHATTTPP